jgi:phosphatidylglycerophosphatase A
MQGFTALLLLSILTFISIWISDQAEKILGQTDDPRIVLDEIIGFFWAVLWIPFSSMDPRHKFFTLLAAFVLFRIFDVLKLPIRKAQNLPAGWGVMADDVLAGMLANVILQILVKLI